MKLCMKCKHLIDDALPSTSWRCRLACSTSPLTGLAVYGLCMEERAYPLPNGNTCGPEGRRWADKAEKTESDAGKVR